MTKFRLLSIIFVCALLAGCRSGKDALRGESSPQLGADVSLTQRAEALAQTAGEWNELNLPVKVELKSPFSISGSGRAYMRRGQDIYISIRMLGFEVLVVYIDSKTVNVADKFNHRYLSEPIDQLLGNVSLTVADIQDLILGRVFVNGIGTFSASMLDKVSLARSSDSQWTITPKNKVAGASYSFSVDNATNVLKSLNVFIDRRTFTCNYSAEALTQCGRFMSDARVQAKVNGKDIDALLRWNFSGAKFEVSESVKWKTPSGYTRINAADLLKDIKF